MMNKSKQKEKGKNSKKQTEKEKKKDEVDAALQQELYEQPFSYTKRFLSKKQRNIEKRFDRLQTIKDKKVSGEKLEDEQKKALENMPVVTAQLDMTKEFVTMLNGIENQYVLSRKAKEDEKAQILEIETEAKIETALNEFKEEAERVRLVEEERLAEEKAAEEARLAEEAENMTKATSTDEVPKEPVFDPEAMKCFMRLQLILPILCKHPNPSQLLESFNFSESDLSDLAGLSIMFNGKAFESFEQAVERVNSNVCKFLQQSEDISEEVKSESSFANLFELADKFTTHTGLINTLIPPMSPQMVHQTASPPQVVRENPQQMSQQQQQFSNQIPPNQQNLQKVSSPPLPTLQESPENNETHEEVAHQQQLQHRSPPTQQLANTHLQKPAQPDTDIRDQSQQRSPLGYESMRAREVAETNNHPIENLLPERNLNNDKDDSHSLLQRAQFEAFEKQNESLDLDERFDLERRQLREQKVIEESYDRHMERRMFEERENDMKRLADPSEQDVDELIAQTRNGSFKDIPQSMDADDYVNRSPQKYEAQVESPEPVMQKPQPPQPKPSAWGNPNNPLTSKLTNTFAEPKLNQPSSVDNIKQQQRNRNAENLKQQRYRESRDAQRSPQDENVVPRDNRARGDGRRNDRAFNNNDFKRDGGNRNFNRERRPREDNDSRERRNYNQKRDDRREFRGERRQNGNIPNGDRYQNRQNQQPREQRLQNGYQNMPPQNGYRGPKPSQVMNQNGGSSRMPNGNLGQQYNMLIPNQAQIGRQQPNNYMQQQMNSYNQYAGQAM